MAAQGWNVVVVDESHTMRTTEHPPDARHTEAVACVIKRARRAVLLSGTPGLNRPFDLFRQVISNRISFCLAQGWNINVAGLCLTVVLCSCG